MSDRRREPIVFHGAAMEETCYPCEGTGDSEHKLSKYCGACNGYGVTLTSVGYDFCELISTHLMARPDSFIQELVFRK